MHLKIKELLGHRAGWLVFSVALIVRLLFMVQIDADSPTLARWGGGQFYDAYDYDYLGMNLAVHGIYGYGRRPSSYRPPGYPAFLALLYRVAGHRIWLVRVGQVLIGSLSCVLLVLMARRLYTGYIPVLVGLAAALYPYFIYFNLQLLSETLFMFWVVLAFWCLLRYKEKASTPYLFAAGIVWGAGCLTRPILLPLTIVPFLWVLYSNGKNVTRGVPKLLVLLAGVLLITGPWTIRNARVHGAFVPVSTNGGYNFYLGNAGYAVWSGKQPDLKAYVPKVPVFSDTEMEKSRVPVSETVAEKTAYNEGFKFIRKNPAAFVKVYLLKVYDYWHIILSSEHSLLKRIAAGLFYGLVLVSGLIGIVRSCISGNRFSLMVGVFIITGSLLVCLYISNIRMRVPLADPFLLVYSGMGVLYLYNLVVAKLKIP